VGVNYHEWLPQVLSVAQAASAVITEFYWKKNYHIEKKLDNSPVTEADIQAHKIIEKGLQTIDPSIPILSEEGAEIPYEERTRWSKFWLVDPLDGTREFIRETDEFTVNIALIENHSPVLGVIVAPILKQSYWASKGKGAYLQIEDEAPQRIHTHKGIRSPLKIAVSRSFHHKDKPAWIELSEKVGEFELIYCGSALKICLVAKGEVDIYPRFGPTGEWDTAAGQCILEEAGGMLVDITGTPLRYNTRLSLINSVFYAMGNNHWATLCCG
jgi:3'(2'), 5'-bisphosphate nucleotidase